MRRLWITRHDAKPEKKAKVKVYIEDADSGKTKIGGCFCRLLGEVENDQVKRFNIGYESAKVFVLSEKAVKPAFVRIGEGEEDVFLEGRIHRDAAAGNPFRFEGVEEEVPEEMPEVIHREEVLEEVRETAPEEIQEEVLEETPEDIPEVKEKAEPEQKKQKPARGKGKGKLIIVIAIIVGIVAGIAGGIFAGSFLLKDTQEVAAAAKTFNCRDLQITLTEDFAETTAAGYTACYSAGDTAVFLMRESFDTKEGFGELDLESYGAMILKNNHIPETVALETADGLTTFAWVITEENTGVPYYYYCGLYKAQDAFWMVQVTTEAEGAAENIPMFRQWLKSVVVAE